MDATVCLIIISQQKPDNVGFSVDGTLKMFDFGLAKEEKPSEADEYGTFKMTGQTGSRRYMAPEGMFVNCTHDCFSCVLES